LSYKVIVSQIIDDSWDEQVWIEPYTTCLDCGKLISRRNDGGNGFCIDCVGEH